MKIVEKKDEDGWCMPVVVNDWGVDAYFLRAQKSDMGTWGIQEQDQSQRLSEGDRVQVRWPNGKVTFEKIVGESHSVTIGDMGHDYHTATERLFVERKVDGKKMRTPLEQCWVKRPEGK